MTTRRSLLKTMTAASALTLMPYRYAFASLPGERRLVVVILRGALDGLAAVPPHGDPDYKDVRGVLALDKDGDHPLLDLDGFFGLHPSLVNMKALYDAKELALFHNICSPYRDRSHFDGQNVLESGGLSPHLLQDGWLNRALMPMGLGTGEHALAVAQTAPLMLSGPARTTSWMPATMPTPDEVFFDRVRALYARDKVLGESLASAMDLQSEASTMDGGMKGNTLGKGKYGDLEPLFTGAGKLLAADGGMRVAVLEASGWDTHVAEGAGDGQLARRLQTLDAAIAAMKTAMGPAVWSKTAVVMATEFGRTVHPNGSNGTDHGTGGAAFLFGGAVAGGGVHAEWVGLKSDQLRDGRDQPARTDLRALFKGVLAEQMGVSNAALAGTVFPDSAAVAPMKGLVRA